MKRLECLDGLRGVLAVYVMLGHMAPFAALPAWLQLLLSHGGAAVDVFFMLSGLVIFRSLESCHYRARPFLIARATRIFPVFLVMFAAGMAVQPLAAPFDAMPWVVRGDLTAGMWSQEWPPAWPVEIAAHLTMTHGLFPTGVLPHVWVNLLGSAWSLSTEWQFYVLALLIGRIRIGRDRLALLFLALAVAGLAWDLLAPEPWRFSRAFLPNKAHYFALGIASAAWVDHRRVARFVAVLACVLPLGFMHGHIVNLLPPLVWTLCLAAQLSTGRWALAAAPLRWRLIQWLGALSYPLYLANEPIQKALGVSLGLLAHGDGTVFTVLWVPGALLLPLGAAVLLHRYVETPAMRWGRALAHGGTITPRGETAVGTSL